MIKEVESGGNGGGIGGSSRDGEPFGWLEVKPGG